MTKTLTIHGTEYDTAVEALQAVHNAHTGEAICIAGRWLHVTDQTVDDLQAAGAEFAYVVVHGRPEGQPVALVVQVSGDA